MTTDAVRFFAEWAESGRADRMAAHHEPRGTQALEQMPIEAGQTCIDLGCGEGWASRWLADRVGPQGTVIGIDGAAAMVSKAQQQPRPGLRFEQGELTRLLMATDSVDHAFSMEALYYVDILQSVHEAARVLRPGGTLMVCTDFYRENEACHDWPVTHGIAMELRSEGEWLGFLRMAGFEGVRSFRCTDGAEDPSPGTLAVTGSLPTT